MFNEIDFSKIDTSITPPQDDTERQYYYMAKLAEMVGTVMAHRKLIIH